MRRLPVIFGVLLLAGGAYWLYRLVFPPDHVVIRKQLHELARELSFRNEGGSPFAALAGVNRLLGYFTVDVEIRLGDTPGTRHRVILGRDELREALGGSRTTSRRFQVRLRDVYLEPVEGRQALAQIIVGVHIDDDEDEYIQELRLRMVKEGRSWLIRQVEPVATLGM